MSGYLGYEAARAHADSLRRDAVRRRRAGSGAENRSADARGLRLASHALLKRSRAV